MHWVFLAPYLACLPIFMRTSQQHSSPTLSGSAELRRQLTAQRKHVLCHWLRSCGFLLCLSLLMSLWLSLSLSLSFTLLLVHPLIGFLVAASQTGLFSLLYCSGRQAEREREEERERKRERERERERERCGLRTKHLPRMKAENKTWVILSIHTGRLLTNRKCVQLRGQSSTAPQTSPHEI